MDPRASVPLVPLHLTSLAILSPSNKPLFVQSFTSKSDELRHYHLSHAAVDVIEERIVMTTTPNKAADSYLGLLFCMEDMAFYGFQTNTKIRMVLSVALVDAMIKDSDIVAIFRAVHHLMLSAVHNPFLSLSKDFSGRRTPSGNGDGDGDGVQEPRRAQASSIPQLKMFATGPEDIDGAWLEGNGRFMRGIQKLGEVLNGGR